MSFERFPVFRKLERRGIFYYGTLAASLFSFLSFFLAGNFVVLGSPSLLDGSAAALLASRPAPASILGAQVEAHLHAVPYLIAIADLSIRDGAAKLTYLFAFYLYLVTALSLILVATKAVADQRDKKIRAAQLACILFFLPALPTFVDWFTVWVPLLVSLFHVLVILIGRDLKLPPYRTGIRAFPILAALLFISLGIGFPALFLWIGCIAIYFFAHRAGRGTWLAALYAAALAVYFLMYRMPDHPDRPPLAFAALPNLIVFISEFLFRPVVALVEALTPANPSVVGIGMLLATVAATIRFQRSFGSAFINSVKNGKPETAIWAGGTVFFFLWIGVAAAFHVTDDQPTVQTRFWLPISHFWLCAVMVFTVDRQRSTGPSSVASVLIVSIASILNLGWLARLLLSL